MANETTNLDMFEDLLDDNGVTAEIVDPETGGYAKAEDFDEFQNNSNATRTVSTEEKPTIFNDIMDDSPADKTPTPDNLIVDILTARGFNPESIKFYNDDGEIEEVKFSELSREEQIELLSAESEVELPEISDTEQEALDFLRENNMSIKDLAQAIKQKTIEELGVQQTEQVYSVDDFNDDELFIIDFKHKYGEDFTEEELARELEKEKNNEDLFNKKMTKLRSDYKLYEDEVRENEKKEIEENSKKEQEQYVNNMIEVAKSISSLHDTVELVDEEKSDILSFMFDQDVMGKSGIQKAFEDPQTLFKVAWYLKHGEETINELHKYYQGEISKISKSSKQGESTKTVIKEKAKNQHTTNRPLRIEDLY